MIKRIVADTSTGGLDFYPHPHNIKIVRINLLIEDNVYRDGIDITANEFYDLLRRRPDLVPKTSQPSVGDMIDFFDNLYNEGITDVFLTTLSSELSGTYNSAHLASLEMKDKMNIEVYDTKTVCFNEGLFALEAEKLLNKGASFEEIRKHLDEFRSKNTIFFAVDTLNYLVKNGRLSGAAAFVGKLLKIKPILQVQDTGKIVAIDKIRTIKKALEGISQKVLDFTQGREYSAHIIYTGNPSLKQHFLTTIKEELGLSDLFESPSTPVVGCHVGPDVIGIGITLK